MKIRLLLFGALRDSVGAKETALALPAGATVATLREQFSEQLGGAPAFDATAERLRVAVNREFADDATPLRDGDEVAFLPPVSGGGARCTLSAHPLDPTAVATRVEGSDCGGVVTFVGAVRDHARGHAIQRLEYEAYPEMALQEMDRIADEAEERWTGTRVAIAHRVGHLDVGDLAVVVVAASPHRAEAFEACRFAIDTLKQRVPIWKKEVANDGSYWVDDHA